MANYAEALEKAESLVAAAQKLLEELKRRQTPNPIGFLYLADQSGQVTQAAADFYATLDEWARITFR